MNNAQLINQTSGNVENKLDCYAVVACRWGWINNGFQILLVTTDKDRAIEKADWYTDYRGGKYGVGVYDAAGKEIYHAPSAYREPEMKINNRLVMFERIGNEIVLEIEMGNKVTHARVQRIYDIVKRFYDVTTTKLDKNGRK